jgi:hypothetical protein
MRRPDEGARTRIAKTSSARGAMAAMKASGALPYGSSEKLISRPSQKRSNSVRSWPPGSARGLDAHGPAMNRCTSGRTYNIPSFEAVRGIPKGDA